MNIAGFLKKYTQSISRSLFLKFFLGYILVALFLVIVIGFYTQFYILKNLDVELERFERKKINETLNTMDVLFGEMNKISLNHALNTRFQQFAYTPRNVIWEKWTEVKSLQELLSNSINSSNYVNNISIFYERNDYVLDYSGLTELDRYYDQGWQETYRNMTGSSAILDTRKVEGRNAAGSSVFNNTITFLTKFPYGDATSEGAIILNVDERIVSDLLRNITRGSDQSLALIANSRGIILSASQEQYLYQDIRQVIQLPEAFLEQTSGSFQLVLNGTELICYFDSSGPDSWRLFYLASGSMIFKKSLTIKNITILILFGLLLLMTAFSLVFALKTYDPIKKIITGIRRMSATSDESLSDASMIQNEIMTLLENNQTLNRQLNENKILVREKFLVQLINGRLFNMAEVRSSAEYFAIRLDFEYFLVAVLQTAPLALDKLTVQEVEFKLTALQNMVEKIFGNLAIAVDCTRNPEDHLLVLLKLEAAVNRHEMEGLIQQTLEDFQNSIDEYLELPIQIGIGSMQKGLAGIGISCKEAQEALHFDFLYEDSPVISYAAIAGSHADRLNYPVEIEQKLMMMIKLCDYDKMVLTLNEMLGYILHYNKSLKNIEVCLSNIIGIIQRSIYDLGASSKGVFTGDDVINPPIDRFASIQQFRDWISRIFQIIINYQLDQQKSDTRSFESDVKQYIDEKYTEEISLVTVAEHFNYNPSYFCKTFKEKTGVSFWDYVSKIRIDKSRALLAETGNSIEQIAGMVGYNNRFSFIRTFKKIVAITPGEYRAKYTVKNDPDQSRLKR